MMCDERCAECAGAKVPISRSVDQQCITLSAHCWLRRGVTLLTLLSFYAHTKNEYIRLRTRNAQNRAVMGSVYNVYTRRVDAGAVSQTAWYFATKLRTATRSLPAPRETVEDVAAAVSRTIFLVVGRILMDIREYAGRPDSDPEAVVGKGLRQSISTEKCLDGGETISEAVADVATPDTTDQPAPKTSSLEDLL